MPRRLAPRTQTLNNGLLNHRPRRRQQSRVQIALHRAATPKLINRPIQLSAVINPHGLRPRRQHLRQ